MSINHCDGQAYRDPKQALRGSTPSYLAYHNHAVELLLEQVKDVSRDIATPLATEVGYKQKTSLLLEVDINKKTENQAKMTKLRHWNGKDGAKSSQSPKMPKVKKSIQKKSTVIQPEKAGTAEYY
ncbi:hypothetical protein Tco_0367991 [Tanacetum coccineum]